MSMTSASPSNLPGAGGECGSQHGYATCLPMQGRTCCSINGYCGSNETYCLVSNGCQSGCVDPSVFYSTLTTITTTTSTNVPTDSSQPTSAGNSTTTTSDPATSSTSIPSPTTNAEHSGGLKGGARIGTIVGGSIVVVLLLALLLFCIHRRKDRPRRATVLPLPGNEEPETLPAPPMAEPINVDSAPIMRPNSRPLYSADMRT